MLPSRVIERIVWSLPYRLSETIVPLWSKKMYDWNSVRCFALPGGDSNGFVRINLKGRETLGKVEIRSEYSELCKKIDSGLKSFSNLETGEPIVTRIDHISESIDRADILSRQVPDLVVHWTSNCASASSGITSDEHGEIHWDRGSKARSGRSGDHSPNGWLAARGPDIPHGNSTSVAGISELGVNILKWVKEESC